MTFRSFESTPDSSYETDSRSDLRLTARYRWLLLIVVLPLFIVITLLAVNQYRDQRAQVLHGLTQNTVSYTIALDGIAKLASDHVLQMQAWSENYLRSPPSYPSDLRAYYTPRMVDGIVDSYTLDEVPAQKRKYIGQLAWLGGDPRHPEVGEVALDQALEFFSLARLTHDVTPYFQWSYYFSADSDFVAIYPWFSADAILKAGNYASLKVALADWFQYEIYLAGTPEQNPQGETYWTAPYIDAGGTGAMVSHGAPVYVADEFRGIVGTDVRLATLERFLKGLPVDVGRLVIINHKHMLLADTAEIPRDSILKAAEILPGVLSEDSLRRAIQVTGDAIEIADHSLIAHNTDNAPWTLIYLVSDEEITALLLPRLLPYAVILAVLAATVFIALYLLRREFISPALALVKYIRDASHDPLIPEPQLPHRWQTWVDVVARAFNTNYEATHRLLDSEERLQQILNNSSAVVYVRDRDERFLLVNRPFERLLGISQEEIVGKQLEEVFPPDTATDFRANDARVIEKNSALEFEESVTLKDGKHTYISNKFPLYDSTGNIYAVCGISTDITKRKQSEEALRQAALGISEAKGNEVFHSLVMHLSLAIGTDYAFIGVLEGDDHIRTRTLYAHGQIQENITYELAGSPCENVVGQQFRYYPDTIQQQFPNDDLLHKIRMESYAAMPLFDSNGSVLGLIAVLDEQPLRNRELVESILQIFSGRAVNEIEREQTDIELRASESSYRAIFEASQACIFIHDINTGSIIDVNQRACDTYGYTKEEMRHLDVGQLGSGVSPYTLEDGAKLIQRAIVGERLNFEWHRKNRDGSLHWDEVFLRCASIAGQDRILAFTHEITARKEAEEKLRTSEEQYRSIFYASSDALILWDAHGNMVDANPAAWEMGGYTKEAFFNKPFDEHIHPSSYEAYNKFKADVATIKAASTDTRAIRKDGAVIDLESRSIPMPYQGKPHILTITRDITEQKRVADELARQRETLRQSEKLSAMGELLAGVAHELNNPLAILMGRTTLLESKIEDDALRDDVSKIHTAADRCGRIVRTFLSMARQKPPECELSSLNDVITSAIDLLGYGLNTSGIDLVSHLDKTLPESNMDTDQIGQVLINLLVNAQHVLTEQPQPRRIEVTTGRSAGGVYCRVSDNGPGVPEDVCQQIFDPFFTTKGSGVGTGVGLSVSQSIAREHGGELRLDSSVHGASFILWLPLDNALLTVEPVTKTSTRRELDTEHVLIVDDEPELASMLAEILQSAGLETTHAHSGREAMRWLEGHSCDLILSDIRMPDMDGPALWRALGDQHPDMLQRTAFITGDTLSASIAPFLRETGQPWLEKPFTPEQVLELVARIEMI